MNPTFPAQQFSHSSFPVPWAPRQRCSCLYRSINPHGIEPKKYIPGCNLTRMASFAFLSCDAESGHETTSYRKKERGTRGETEMGVKM